MASRFICTHECDAHENFKTAFLKATRGDVVIVDSPAGLPSRALKTPFIKSLFAGDEVAEKCFATCLSSCRCRDEEKAFCIAHALHQSQQGDLKEGLIFTGTNAVRHDRIVHIWEIFEELTGQPSPNRSK